VVGYKNSSNGAYGCQTMKNLVDKKAQVELKDVYCRVLREQIFSKCGDGDWLTS